MNRLAPLLLVPLLAACPSDPDELLDGVDVDTTDFDDDDVPIDGRVYELDAGADPELVFTAVGSTGPQHGTWSSYNVRVIQPDDAFESLRISVLVEMNTVETNYTALTNHLNTDDFLDTANHPEGTFESSEIAYLSGDDYLVSGTLTLRGTSREISFPATIAADGEGLVTTAVMELSRWDFGLIRPSAGEAEADGVQDSVDLEYSVRLAEVE